MALASATIAPQTRPAFWKVTNWRLSQKLLLTFLGLAIVPIVVAGVISVNASREALLNQGRINLVSISNNTANEIDQYLTAHSDDIVMVSQLPNMVDYAQNPNVATKTDALRALKAAANKKDYESVAVTNKVGATILSSAEQDMNTSVQSHPYFVEALKGRMYVSDPSVSIVTNRPAIFFSAPILSTRGEVLGVIYSRLSLDAIWALVESDKNKAGSGTVGILLDENGIRLAHSLSLGDRDAAVNNLLYRAVAPLPKDVETKLISEKRFGQAAADTVAVKPLPEVSQAMTGPKTQTFESSADNTSVRHYAAETTLNAKPWRYVVMAPIQTFTSAADSLTSIFIIIAVVVGALTSVAAIFMSRSITRPIVRLSQVADRISLGELEGEIDISSNDEIGELARAFKRMQVSMRGAIERLRSARKS